jgi:hypothetical protein
MRGWIRTRILSVGIPHIRPFDGGIKSIFHVYLTYINYFEV